MALLVLDERDRVVGVGEGDARHLVLLEGDELLRFGFALLARALDKIEITAERQKNQ